MTKRKKLVLKIALVIAAVILAGILTFGGICLYLMDQDNISDKYTITERDDSFLGTILKGAVMGSEFELTEAQVNTYLDNTFCAEDKPLRKIRVCFYRDMPAEVYARIFYMNRERAFYARIQLGLIPEKGVTAVRFSDVKIGELKIHSHVIDSLLNDFAKSTPLAEFKDGVLYIKTEYSYEGRNFSLTIKLEKLEPSGGTVLCKTNSLTHEVIYAVKDYLLSEDGQEFFKNIFGEKINDIKNLLLRIFF